MNSNLLKRLLKNSSKNCGKREQKMGYEQEIRNAYADAITKFQMKLLTEKIYYLPYNNGLSDYKISKDCIWHKETIFKDSELFNKVGYENIIENLYNLLKIHAVNILVDDEEINENLRQKVHTVREDVENFKRRIS